MVASVFHFTASEVELRLIPPFLPWRRAALYITGVLEFVGGLGLLLPRFQEVAGRGVAALLVAIFPANVYQTFTRKQFTGLTSTPLYHIVRWPLQGVLIWWALWCSKKS
ncbi:membrane protein [Tengunoibacter tsumagoiensis]|uniref:Membrane protein n=2 Tax=Tengunoibacter tsumagoiensis TaxID=2014871 RepID=A0A402A3Q1_9CHLR|nr:membrane protein [Tengunoibacter tsumagoiensis]